MKRARQTITAIADTWIHHEPHPAETPMPTDHSMNEFTKSILQLVWFNAVDNARALVDTSKKALVPGNHRTPCTQGVCNLAQPMFPLHGLTVLMGQQFFRTQQADIGVRLGTREDELVISDLNQDNAKTKYCPTHFIEWPAVSKVFFNLYCRLSSEKDDNPLKRLKHCDGSGTDGDNYLLHAAVYPAAPVPPKSAREKVYRAVRLVKTYPVTPGLRNRNPTREVTCYHLYSKDGEELDVWGQIKRPHAPPAINFNQCFNSSDSDSDEFN